MPTYNTCYAYYKYMPQELIDNAKAKLPQWMLELNDELDEITAVC